MNVRHTKSYLDRIFAEPDLMAIYQVISAVEQERPLPEEFWAFQRLYEFAPNRSGVWQHYESLPDEPFQRMLSALERFGFHEFAKRYREGRAIWDRPQIREFDDWLEDNHQKIWSAALALIVPLKDRLLELGGQSDP